MSFNRIIWNIIIFFLLAASSSLSQAGIQVGTDQELRDALNQTDDTRIILNAGVRFEPSLRYRLSLSASYEITTNKDNPAIIDGRFAVDSAFDIATDIGLDLKNVTLQNFTNSAITISGNSRLALYNVHCQHNGSNQTMGGCVNADNIDSFKASHSYFENNNALTGGALYIRSRHTKVTWSMFADNNAQTSGGDAVIRPSSLPESFSLSPEGVWMELNMFRGFSAGLFGASIEVLDDLTEPAPFPVHVANNKFKSTSSTPALEFNYGGPIFMTLNSFHIGGDLLNSVSPALVSAGNLVNTKSLGSVVSTESTSPINIKPTADCNIFAGQLFSFGFNIINADGCAFNQPTDQLNTNPGFTPDDPDLGLQSNSPAVDAQQGEGLLAIPLMITALSPEEVTPILACGVVDALGFGRPQDANGDGVFECDLGARELRNGPDITAAQTMAVFDPNRIGEGQFLEILPNGLAAMSFFSFGPNGGQDWFISLGQQAGNTVVFNTINDATGGIWGTAFDPSSITRTNAGQASFVFSTCEASTQPGRFMFQSAPSTGRSDVFNRASRLSTSIDCNGQMANPNSTRTGSYFGGAARNGEGLQYIELNNGQAVAVFYGYDPQGNKFWTTSAPAAVNGNTATLQMQYPATTTGFGVNFDPEEIQTQPFGSMTLTFNPDGTITFSMNPVVAGFGSINYTMMRLTTPLGLGT